MDWKIGLLIGLLCLVVGSISGAVMFPHEITKTVTETVEVPVIEQVEVPFEVIKEVVVEDTAKIDALEEELGALIIRYEQLTDERYKAGDVSDELRYIQIAKEDLEGDYKFVLLREDYLLSEISIEKYYSEAVKVKEVTRWVDGKKIDYDQATVEFEVKVAYENTDGLEFKRFDVEVIYDIDIDGDEEIEVSVWLV